MILTGIIHTIFEEEEYRSFRKTVIWLQEMNVQYPNVWQIEFFNDEGKWLNKFNTGQLVNVNIAIIGRKKFVNGEERVYNTIRGIKIQALKK